MNIQPKITFALCIIAVIGIGLLHAMMPKDISMFLLYLGPILVAAHFLRPPSALAITTLALVIWSTAYIYGFGAENLLTVSWNILCRALLYYTATFYTLFLVAKLREEKIARKEIERLQRKANPLAGAHLCCDECGKINSNNNEWLTPLDFLRSVAHVEVHTCICPTCVVKVKNPAGSQEH